MNEQLKPFKTVEQIAQKHRLDVSFIQKQLDMGEPIEHEHTKDHKLAMEIALQHLDEIPDYYTRLKKMEASAKKEHKKFKDVKESNEEQRYCPLCDKREGRSECSYGGKAWDKVSVKDHEYSMARSELDTLVKAAERIKKKVGKGEGSLEAWVQSKITKAADYIDTAADYIASGEMEESFTINPAAHKVAAKRRKIEALTTSSNSNEADVAKRKLGKTTELPKVKKEERLVDKILGELQEEDPCWKGYTQVGMKKKAGKPVPNCVPSKGVPKAKGNKKEDVNERADFWHPDPEQDRKLGGPGANQRAREDGVASKSTFTTKSNNKLRPGESYMQFAKRKQAEKMKEDVTIEDANGNTFAEVVDLIKPEPIKGFKQQVSETTRLQSETGNILAVILSWRGKSYSIRMFFPQTGMPSRKDVTDEIQKIYPGSQVLQYNVSSLQPGMPLIQVVNSKSKNYLLNNKTIGEETIEEGMNIKDFKANRKKNERRAASVDAEKRGHVDRTWGSGRKYTPDEAKSRRSNMSDLDRSQRYRVANDPDSEHDNYPADKTKNPKKIRKQTAMGESAAWQRKEGKSQSGGLNEKGRKSYERENPGSDLKAPQPEGGSRRDSFCARMKGMKKKLTSAKTANDPDSRINKSLRAWNC